MPVWHQLTEDARRSGELVVLGVIQEQHAERCRLYKQWQGFEWPIVQDAFNALHARAVPMFVALDENGVVIDNSLRGVELESFLNRPAAEPKLPFRVDELDSTAPPTLAADEILRWGEPAELSKAILLYEQILLDSPDNGPAAFSLGVAYRKRFDSEFAQPTDFQKAIDAWGMALEIDPNQYIYRRRIQQYGPRLIKPYPFYDWVEQAQTEISARGDKPIELKIALSGAEIALPAKRQTQQESAGENPDPEGRILRDTKGLIASTGVVVPSIIKAGDSVRIHLSFQPHGVAHWNNEADPVIVWLSLPDEWQSNRQLFKLEQPREAETREERRLEIEIQSSENATSTELKGFALYYICEEQSGQCLFRRLDFSVILNVR